MWWPIPLRIVILAVICIPTINSAAAFDAAVRAPVACTKGASCGFDIKLSEAKESAVKVVSACREKHSKENQAKCSLRAATQYNICGEPFYHYYTWAYLEDVADGKSALAELEAAATSGQPFGPGMIVEVSGTPADEKHLALCYISRVKGVLGGPPTGCTTVAIITPETTLLRGESTGGRTGDRTGSRVCFSSASIRLDTGIIDIKYKVQTTLGIVKFSDSLQQMLSGDLGLTVDSDVTKSTDGSIYSVSLRSNSPLRESKILKGGWRESLGFDLQVGNHGEYIDIHGTTEPMICRTASGSLVDYQIPDDAQRGVYARTLDSLVGAALTKVCSHYRTIDATTIACQ